MTNIATAFSAAPVSLKERIDVIDSLRGIAILGILMMNIPGFGLPSPGFSDPALLGELGTINFRIWYFIDWFLEGSQRGLFSMLFGAGIILFISRLEKRAGGMWPADYFFRRQLWLMVFGLLNSFVLLWFWDILLDYACCGMIMFAFRRLSPRALLISAGICLVFMTVRENVDFYRNKAIITQGESIAALDTTTTKLTEVQKEKLEAWTDFRESRTVEAKTKKMESSLRKTRGDYADLYPYFSERRMYGVLNYLFYGLWDVLIFMFIGMAFYKTGILMGNGSYKLYWLMAIVGLGGGLIISRFRLQPMIDLNFDSYAYTRQVVFEYYEISRTVRSIGIFGLTMLLYKSGWVQWLFAMMRPVGRMAFTNYLTQSLFVGLFFYGVGFGMFGHLQRYELYIVVAVVWVVQIIWSHIWLRFFRFGPLEWAWRSLTYWKIQPFKKDGPATDSMGVA